MRNDEVIKSIRHILDLQDAKIADILNWPTISRKG
jgi:uncharacterized protein YehS (DUF1456 family)